MIAEAVILAGIAGPQPCDDRAIWEAWLRDQYNERYAFTVRGPSSTPMEVWIDPDGGDWTMLGITDDQMCEIIFGTDWPESRR